MHDSGKDLIQEILLNEEFDWGFAFINSNTKRPSGEVLFMVSQDLRKHTSSRAFILKSREAFHILGQVQIDRNDGNYLIDFENLIEYQQTCNRNGILRSIDIDNPFYNVEWHFTIQRSLWFSIMNELKTMTIPVLPTGLVYSGEVSRTMWVKKELDYLTFKWTGDDEKFEKVTDIMNNILNIALKNINTAYWIN
ncbi:MAG: hypothetical protein J7604_07035 [Sporocytophaga sp.]|uniref:hypothetical protein n=1 Tax=Sporocytophaga sp. TaxID=2231183 RepID=UPI001B0B2BF4|nr:hypothetical protein [Sporocytophaga sp.]MBO9699947.1 hypothetical protein [Sporocytophaga sp.]